MFFRSSSSRIFMDLQIAQNLLPIETNSFDRWDDGDDWQSSSTRPTEVGLFFGLGW